MAKTNNPVKHHIIPEFLLRKFAIDPKKSKRKKQVWLYQKGQNPLRKNTRKLFFEKHRYDFPGGGVWLEHEFSTEEENYSEVVEKILNDQNTLDEHLPALIEFIHNLNYRVRAHNYVKARAASSKKEREKTTKKIIEQLGPDLSRRSRAQIELYESSTLLSQEKKGIPKYRKLSKDRFRHLNRFHWELKENLENTYILGDTGVVGYSMPDSRWKHLLYIPESNLKLVVFPLSPKFALIGHPRLNFVKLTIDEINEGIAIASRNAFISSKCTMARFTKKIGISNPSPSDKDEVKSHFLNIQAPYRGKNSPSEVKIKLTFLENCTFNPKVSALLSELKKTFEQDVKSLSLSKSFFAEWIFTSDMDDTLKRIKLSPDNAIAQSPSANSNKKWLPEAVTQTKHQFKRLFIINMNHLNKPEMQNDILFGYFLDFYKLAAEAYQDKYGNFETQTASIMQRIGNYVPRSSVLFQKVVNVHITNLNRAKDKHVTRIKQEILSFLNDLSSSLLLQTRFCVVKNITFSDFGIKQKKIIEFLCFSFAEFLALATSEQSDEFFDKLKQIDVFKVIFEDEWKNFLKLCDEKAMIDSECIFRVRARCHDWLCMVALDRDLFLYYYKKIESGPTLLDSYDFK